MSTDLTAVDTDIHIGLTSAEVEQSRANYGDNSLSPLPTSSVWDFLQENFKDPMLRILFVCAIVTLGLGFVTGDYIDGIAIALAAVIVTIVGTYNQVSAQRDYTALDEVQGYAEVRVIRDGEVQSLDVKTIVVGDVIEVNTGDVLPADCVFKGHAGLLVNEAHITGEPETGKEYDEVLYGASRILDGSGRAIVTGVGDSSVFGKVRLEIGERDKTTPLQERLEVLAGQIGKYGTYAAVLTFIALIGVGLTDGSLELAATAEAFEYVLEALTIAVTIVVVAVPEGLPLAVTLALAYTTRKMAAAQTLVRELAACETMGAATIVCSDKTGTMTSGAMRVVGTQFGTGDVGGLGEGVPDELRDELIEGVAINSSSDLIERDGELVVAGNSTEGALLYWLQDQGVSYRPFRESLEPVHRREFNSSRKHMMTAVPRGEGLRVHIKGAPEIVLGFCSTVWTPSGPVPLDDSKVESVLESVRDQARRGQRTLGFAIKDVARGIPEDQLDTHMVFLGLFVIEDPIRPDVAAAVGRCRSAGVRVMMITGDIHETAVEIATRAGVIGPGQVAITGTQFREMDDAHVLSEIRDIAVLSRALPDDKRRMVELLQSTGDVVSVTGDGVNDAPALVAADVGFAMGSGSKVAREASDIVLVDDSFVSLVGAIGWGRSVFENIRKFLQFQLTVNVVALTTAFLAAMFGLGTPLTAVQLLWVNLIMDSLAALALALEPPTEELYEQEPHGRNEPLITRSMWISVLAIGAYMLVIMFMILFSGVFVPQGEEATGLREAFLFSTFVWMTVFNEFNARSTRFHRNPFKHLFASAGFLSIVGIIVVLQVLILLFGGEVFNVVPMTAGQWGMSIALGASVLVAGWVVRIVGRAVVPAPERGVRAS